MANNNDYLLTNDGPQAKFKVSKTSKIDYLIDEDKYDEALSLINKTLEKEKNSNNWHLKAIILDNLKNYQESVECYDRALMLDNSIKIKKDKANTLYKWAKVSYFPDLEYEKALKLVNDALEIIPEGEDSSEYYFLKGEILEALRDYVGAKKSYLIAYGEFDKLKKLEDEIDYLANTTDELINITGGHFYDFTPKEGLIVNLVKEEDNEHDPDAIAVYLDKNKIGYVANSDYTLIDEVTSATKLKNKVSDNTSAEILFVYLDEYIIARLLK